LGYLEEAGGAYWVIEFSGVIEIFWVWGFLSSLGLLGLFSLFGLSGFSG